MSIIYCEKHHRRWDSDFHDDCSLCENELQDVCVHGKGFDVICVECCPEDTDGSFTGDEWSAA